MKKNYCLIALAGVTALSAGIVILSQNNNSFDISSLHVSNAAAPTNQRRVWIIDNNGSSSETSWWGSHSLFIHYWNDKGGGEIPANEKVLSDYYKGLWYFDVSLEDVTTSLCLIVRVGDDEPMSWGNNNQTFTLELGAIGTADTIWLNDGVTWDGKENRNNRNASIGTTNGFSGDQLAVVMSKYNTCSSNTTNGYNAYSQMKTNFFDKTDSAAFSTKVYGQDVYTIQDYVDAMAARSGN